MLGEREKVGVPKREYLCGNWALGELKHASRGVVGGKYCSTISVLFPFHMLPAQQECWMMIMSK